MSEQLILENGDCLSLRHVDGKQPHEIVFMHGTLSDKNASKSLFLEEFCRKNNIRPLISSATGNLRENILTGQSAYGLETLWKLLTALRQVL